MATVFATTKHSSLNIDHLILNHPQPQVVEQHLVDLDEICLKNEGRLSTQWGKGFRFALANIFIV